MPSVLPRDERHQLDARCDLLVSDALAALAGFSGAAPPERWRPLAQREHLVFHCEQQPSSGSSERRFLLSGYLTGSLAQVTSGLYSASTRDFTLQQCVLLAGNAPTGGAANASLAPRSFTATSSTPAASAPGGGCAFVDAAVLQVIEQETRHAPFRFAGVKWYAWRSSAGVDCDLLAYERSGVAALDADIDTNNNNSRSTGGGGDATEIMYHVLQAIERPVHAPLESNVKFPPGMRHMKLSVCFLYRQVCDDLVECFAIGEYPTLRRNGAGCTSTLQRAEDDTVAERVLTVSRALAAYSAKRLSRLIEKNKKLPVIMSKSCLRCGTRRTVFDSLRTCSICKKSVCQSCRQERTVFQLNIDTNRPETEVFCRKCLQCSNLPDESPVSLEKIKQKKARANSGGSSDRSLLPSSSHPPSTPPPSSERDRHAHRHRSSTASNGSGTGGARDSITSASSSSASSSAHRHSRQQQRPQQQQQQVRATVINGPNYDGLFRHYAVEKPVITRARASTLPSSTSSHSSSDANSVNLIKNNRNSVLGLVSAREAAGDDGLQQRHQHRPRLQPLSMPAAAEAVELVQGEEVVLGECLRDTQIGLPVILVDESLRQTQLGMPVEVEVGRVSESLPPTTSRATRFINSDAGRRSSVIDNVTSAQLSPPSPRRSDLYLNLPDAPVKSGSGAGEGGVEKLYQTYLERREKLETAAADEQQLRNARLEVSRMHQQQQQERRARGNSTGHGIAMQGTNDNQSHHDRDAVDEDANQPQQQQAYRHLLYQPHRHQSNQPEALTKQHFRFDLYAQP